MVFEGLGLRGLRFKVFGLTVLPGKLHFERISSRAGSETGCENGSERGRETGRERLI